MRLLLMLPLLLAPLASIANECDGILTVRDTNFEARSLFDAESINQKHCKSNGTLRSGGGALELSIPKIPATLKLGGSSTKQKMEHFCKNYQSWRNKIEKEVSYKSSTSEQQWQAYNNCIYLKSRGVNIKPQIGKELITISLTRGTENFQFKSLMHSPEDAFNCTGDKNIKANELVGTEVTNARSLTFTCKRKAKEDKGKAYFDSGEIAIVTDRGDLIIPIPPEEKYRPHFSSELKNELNTLKDQLVNVQAYSEENRGKLGKIKFHKACVAQDANGCKPKLPNCPNGWLDTGIDENNTWLGGSCGHGQLCRICYQIQ